MEENNLLDKVNKLSLPATILIAAVILGGFYFAVEYNKQRSIEKQQQTKIEQEQQKLLSEQKVKEETKEALDTCLIDASKSYADQWHRECKRLGKLTNKCIDINELSYSEYLNKYGLTGEEYAKQRGLPSDSALAGVLDYLKRRTNECSCALSISLADSVNEDLQRSKDTCFKKYPQR